MVDPLNIPARTLGALLLRDFCPRCFWIVLHCENKLPFQIPMPGIFSSIDAYGKNVIHTFFDQNKRLPPWYPDIGDVAGYIPSRQLHWSKFRIEDRDTRIILRGTPDDIFRLSNDSHHIVDYKTAKATVKQDELFPLYQVQLNVYAYICNTLGQFPATALSLIYVEPQTDLSDDQYGAVNHDVGFALNFNAVLRRVELTAEELVPELLHRARGLYEEPKPPEGRDGCRDCELLSHLFQVAV